MPLTIFGARGALRYGTNMGHKPVILNRKPYAPNVDPKPSTLKLIEPKTLEAEGLKS